MCIIRVKTGPYEVWVKSVTVSQTTSVRPERIRTIWTACVRSEQQYGMCSQLFFNNEKLLDARHSYELFGRVYLRRRKLLNKGYCIIGNIPSVAFRCSFGIRGTKDVSRTADFKRHWPISTWVSYRSDTVQVRLSYIYRERLSYDIFRMIPHINPRLPYQPEG